MAEHDEEFEAAGSGAAKIVPAQCSSLRKGGHVMLKDHPCKIMEMSTSKTGKHGHAKVHIVGLDIFTGNKYEENSPSTHNIDVPIVTRKEYQILSISDDNYFCLMDDDGNTSDDLCYDGNICSQSLDDIKSWVEGDEYDDKGNKIETATTSDDYAVFATVVRAVDKEKVVEVKKKKST